MIRKFKMVKFRKELTPTKMEMITKCRKQLQRYPILNVFKIKGYNL